MYRFPLYILFFLLPLIHTKFFDTIFLPTSAFVNGNFEFTKTVFFYAISSLVIGSFTFEHIFQRKNIIFPKKACIVITFLIGILCISTYFSLSPYISIFGNGDKSHSMFLFLNLIGITIVLYNTPKKVRKNILIAIYSSIVAICLLSIKEYFFPTFDYGALQERAIGTFGHPNYLSLFLLVSLPLLVNKKRYLPITLLVLITLFLTKSLLGIALAILFVFWCILSTYKIQKHPAFLCLILLWFFAGIGGLFFFLPAEKIHSFISRFYLWETTLHIIVSDWKILIFGAGLETLPIYFNSFKVPELYIFENFGFSADRPHNFVLNVWYHLWLWGFLLLWWCIKYFIEHIRAFGWWKYAWSILLFFSFCMLNYPSVWVYIWIVFCIVQILKKHTWIHRISVKIWMIGISIVSLFSAIIAVSLYQAETFAYKKQYIQAQKIFPKAEYLYKVWESTKWKLLDPLPSENFYISKIQNFQDILWNCHTLTTKFPSVENYFYCGKVLERIGKTELSKDFYRIWVWKLPDLWNTNSPYWQNSLIQKTITGNRFFHPKFSNIRSILEKLEIQEK